MFVVGGGCVAIMCCHKTHREGQAKGGQGRFDNNGEPCLPPSATHIIFPFPALVSLFLALFGGFNKSVCFLGVNWPRDFNLREVTSFSSILIHDSHPIFHILALIFLVSFFYLVLVVLLT